MRKSRRALSVITLGALMVCARPAAADWLIIPHFGAVFGANTTIVIPDLAQGAGSKAFTIGGSGALLTDGILGLEVDAAHTPHFFERGNRDTLVLDSSVTTVTGSVLFAVPVSVTRESLRPYLVGGVGLMHASTNDAVGLFSFDSNLVAMNLGGGVIGFVTPFTGVRFDLRQFRNLVPDSSATTTSGGTRLSFWRASVGVVLRY